MDGEFHADAVRGWENDSTRMASVFQAVDVFMVERKTVFVRFLGYRRYRVAEGILVQTARIMKS